MVSEPTLAVSRVGVGHGPSMYTGVCGSVRGHRGCTVSTGCMDVYMCCLALGYTVVAKRGDPGPLSHMSKLVQCLDEDVKS